MAPKSYHSTAKGLFNWANSELEHVGRIAAVEDPDLQYAYAMSTLNGMAHLKDAIYEYINTNDVSHMKSDLRKIHDKVVRVMRHLVRTYNLNIQNIIKFNTRHTLSNLSYLKVKAKKGTRGIKANRRTQKMTRKGHQGGCGCMLRRGGRARKSRRQRGGDGQETTDYTVQGIPTTNDDKSVVVIGDYGPVTAKEFQEVAQQIENKKVGPLS